MAFLSYTTPFLSFRQTYRSLRGSSSTGRAEQIRARLRAPVDGQGDWRRTQRLHRLHRNATCLLLAHQLGVR